MAAFGASLLLEEGGLQESSSRAARAAGAAPGADRARASKTVATNAALGCAAVASAGLLLGWVCLGRILTLHNVVRGKTLAGLAWLSGCCLYVGTVTSCCTGCGTGGWQDELGKQVGIMQSGRQQGSQTLADLMAAFTVGVVAAEAAGRWALSGHYTRGRWVSPNLAPVLVVCIFAALCSVKQSFVKAGAADSDSQDWQCTYWALRAVNLPSALLGLVALVALWSSSAWLPITYDRQLVAERLLVDSRCGGSGAHNCTRISHSCSSLLPYQQTVLAGLGTMEAGPTKPPQKGEADTDTAPVIVLIHGLGSGSGHFCEQMVELSENHRLLCVEWRGCGRSNRAKFTPKNYEETLEWFLPALDAWFEAAGLRGKRVTLVGHSMGSIIASEYCWRYPRQIGALVLASPAGLPDEKVPEHLSGSCNPRAVTQILWNWGVTPFAFLRLLGPLGRPIIRAVMYWRLSETNSDSHSRDALLEPIQSYLNEYMYQSLAVPSSGEQAMTTLLHPDVRGMHISNPHHNVIYKDGL